MGRVRERVEDGWASLTEAEVWIFDETSFGFDKNQPVYIIPGTPHANSCGHTSSLPPTRCTWIRLLLACHPHKFLLSHLPPATYTTHVITFPSSMPPTQFKWHFHWEHACHVYFRYQVYFLIFLFPVSDFCSCIDRCQRNQVNIQQ